MSCKIVNNMTITGKIYLRIWDNLVGQKESLDELSWLLLPVSVLAGDHNDNTVVFTLLSFQTANVNRNSWKIQARLKLADILLSNNSFTWLVVFRMKEDGIITEEPKKFARILRHHFIILLDKAFSNHVWLVIFRHFNL